MELEPVRSHPGQERAQLSPTGRHDAETLNGHFENGDFTNLKRWIVDFGAFLNKGELNSRCNRYTIEGGG